ncbi:Uncharacterised protein [Metamycoplasma cloacale]|uniref:Uncharacterized protein n=1 Tax=Metamycoplasma cloacale TaxID=92401 RepID=A0A2Z4LME4_9BACT|nr:hypothetical protein [Metamycoplasma cloacale]AWX42929.1 hypothetical protein DK849_02570 [Metamycoplasma cloacale]VEU79247.1 Uncharacterised protein [Metamycoplasma cloacale]
MSKMTKKDLEKYKGKKIIFKRVSSGEDIKVKISSWGADYKFKTLYEKPSSWFSTFPTIKAKIVTSGEDVKLEQTDSSWFNDFEIYFE